MSYNATAEAEFIVDVLEYVDRFQDEMGQENYADLSLSDVDYLARELSMDADELIALLRENF
jgi:hypothetical protein